MKKNICVLYCIPSTQSIKYSNWTDGFTSALSILKTKYNITLHNVLDNNTIDFNIFDLICFKESFEGYMFNKFKDQLKDKKKALFISSSTIIPTDEQLNLYSILFYETEWYCNYANLKRHKHSYHAFGVNTDIMRPLLSEKKYDVIFVGDIKPYKRPLMILSKEGIKLCVGFKTDEQLISQLEKENVEVQEFVSYDDLSMLYNSSKLCYIPCELHGGGERAVLEARACGIPVEIFDNEKLEELLVSPVYSHIYYASQIDTNILKIQI